LQKRRVRRKPLTSGPKSLYDLRAAHRLWDDGRYPDIKVITDCTVEINLTSRRVNIIKGPNIIIVIKGVPSKVLAQETMELEVKGGRYL
jgi:hypothetical protein